MGIRKLTDVRCAVGESPVWDELEQMLYFVDIAGETLHRLDPATGVRKIWPTPGPVTAMALAGPGTFVIGMKDTVYRFVPGTGETQPLAVIPAQPANATINDGRVDRQGRFVFGSCCTDFAAPSEVGGIYSLAQGRCARLADGITFSNGTCFSPDGATLYFADGALHAVYAYAYDVATGQVGERRFLADTTPLGGQPDGATVDSTGKVWVTVNGGGKVAAFQPDGAIAEVVELPTARPGSVAFGGPGLDTLFVTTIDLAYFGEPQDENCGHVFAIDGLGVCGLAEPRYRP